MAKDKEHAKSVALGIHGIHAYIRVYDISIEKMRNIFKIKEFKKASINWVKFIIQNRTTPRNSGYDVVIGPTADARAQDEIEKFCRMHKRKEPSIKEYKPLISNLNPFVYSTQIVLLTQDVIDYVEDYIVNIEIIK